MGVDVDLGLCVGVGVGVSQGGSKECLNSHPHFTSHSHIYTDTPIPTLIFNILTHNAHISEEYRPFADAIRRTLIRGTCVDCYVDYISSGTVDITSIRFQSL